jgi:acyl-CoA thioesterase
MNGAGVLHGGVTATLADVAVGMALARHLGRPRAAATVEMKVNYLRPVAQGKITARSHLVKVGSRLCCGRVEIFDAEKRPVAAALITYMILNT